MTCPRCHGTDTHAIADQRATCNTCGMRWTPGGRNQGHSRRRRRARQTPTVSDR